MTLLVCIYMSFIYDKNKFKNEKVYWFILGMPLVLKIFWEKFEGPKVTKNFTFAFRNNFQSIFKVNIEDWLLKKCFFERFAETFRHDVYVS